jgi:AcrR family transcriptional regulator
MSPSKQQRIIDAAMHLFNENGFHATPTSLIAKKAKVSVGTLFNYFKTKEDLIEAIYVHIKLHSKAMFLEELTTHKDSRNSLLAMWRAIVHWGTSNPEEFKYLELFCHSPLKSTYQRERSLQAYQEFQQRIRQSVAHTGLSDADLDFILDYIDHALHATIRYLIEHVVENPEHFSDQAFDMLWNGLSLQQGVVPTILEPSAV